MSAAVFREVVPFAAGCGMEIGITIDAVRAGYRLREYELDLEHRASGRSLRGFVHRAASCATSPASMCPGARPEPAGAQWGFA